MEYAKVKSVAKHVTPKGPALDSTILSTLRIASDVVGATLGPHGQPVLIERFEHNVPPMITKDGVTVFRALGLMDPASHVLMEACRNAAERTASEAGDGTTTATILAESIVRKVHEYCKRHRRESPQRVVRALENTLRTVLEPEIAKLSVRASLETEEGRKLLRSVATISANGDVDLAKAVMQCFDITGDEGNVTIAESSGLPRYEVDQIRGFAIGEGYDNSCGKFAPAFINDKGTQQVVLTNPVFLLHHGTITEIQTLIPLMGQVVANWLDKEVRGPHNVVVIATGFSEMVLANLAANFSDPSAINVFPLVIPHSPQSNGQLQFLQDVQAITGAEILDPISFPIEQADPSLLGPGVERFECSRFRSTIIGQADEDRVIARVEQLNEYLRNPESQLDAILTNERKAKLTGGIAKLHVIGASNGELKEKKDRAEDAVCAVRGALKNGCLPGGGWALLKLIWTLPSDPINDEILKPALLAPFERLVSNSGVTQPEEFKAILDPIMAGIVDGQTIVYDFLNQKHVDAFEGGVLDSTPAVREALRNSMSIATQAGTLGGIIVFARDHELERKEAANTASWLRDASVNEADQRP